MHSFGLTTSFCLNNRCHAEPIYPRQLEQACPLLCNHALKLRDRVRHDTPQAVELVRLRLGPAKHLAMVEDCLARWADSIEDCCRRGLGFEAILTLAQTYSSIDQISEAIISREMTR